MELHNYIFTINCSVFCDYIWRTNVSFLKKDKDQEKDDDQTGTDKAKQEPQDGEDGNGQDDMARYTKSYNFFIKVNC